MLNFLTVLFSATFLWRDRISQKFRLLCHTSALFVPVLIFTKDSCYIFVLWYVSANILKETIWKSTQKHLFAFSRTQQEKHVHCEERESIYRGKSRYRPLHIRTQIPLFLSGFKISLSAANDWQIYRPFAYGYDWNSCRNLLGTEDTGRDPLGFHL